MKKSKFIPLVSVAGAALMALAACGGSPKEFKSNSDALGMTVDEMEQLVLGDYDALYQTAAAIVDGAKTGERYRAFAEAEYNLIYESAIIIPWLQQNGYAATVSKTVPWQAGRASYGLTTDKFKNVVAITEAINQEKRAKVTADYEAKKGTAPAPSVDADGYTSLANQYPNPAIEGGKYTVGEGTENEVEFSTKSTYKTTYSKEIGEDCLNYLCNTWTYNSYHYTNMVDGLVENDKYGNIVGAIATAYKSTVNADGTQTWSFKIRDDATWVKNSDGTKYADVKAEDFVTGAKYVLDARHNSGTASIIYGNIVGAEEYYAATAAWEEGDEEPSFDGVGIKVVDNKVEYTCKVATPYFLSGLTYSPYLPVNADFLEEQGSSFGLTENNILVNGAFRLTTHNDQSQINYTKNSSYYDAAHVYVDTIERKFVPGTATNTTLREWFESGATDAFTVSPKDVDGYNTYVKGGEGGTGTQKNPANPLCNSVTSVGDATFIGYWNFNRSAWEVNDPANAKTYDQKLATAKALLNADFRKAFLYGLDVIQELKMYNNDEPYNYLARAYTNRELCAYGGKDYLDYVDDVYNEKNGLTGDDKVTLTGINQQGDPIFDIDKAGAFLNAFKEAVIADGTLTEADFPIRVDLIGSMDLESAAYEEEKVKAFNENFGDIALCVFNIPNSDDQDGEWGNVICNYDLSFWSGWGPDYADPNTYAHTLCIDGDMVEYLGF